MNRLILAALALLPLACKNGDQTNHDAFVNTGDYAFSGGAISREVLDNYLSRAVTEAVYLSDGTEDDTRMLLNIGAKFIGRALYVWGGEERFNDPQWLAHAKEMVDAYHEKDPDAIFQACLFEAIYKKGIEQVPVPAWVFEAFGLEPEERNFDYEAMCFPDGTFRDHWSPGGSVPDMTQTESQMWFYFMGMNYLRIGIEAFHLGQIDLICRHEPDTYASLHKVQCMLREAAKTLSRRGTILFDAHSTKGGAVVDGKHLLDFTSFPLRLREVVEEPIKATLEPGYLDSIIGRTLPGTTPSGWFCDRLPYILEFDNFGRHPDEGQATLDSHFIWGYDEISWISRCDEAYQNEFFAYAMDVLKETDPVGFIQMPGMRGSVGGRQKVYRLNTVSAACPDGHNGEETVKRLWNNE